MKPERYQRIREIFEHLCDLDPAEVPSRLDELCESDEQLHDSVRALLDMDSSMQAADSEPVLNTIPAPDAHGLPESIGEYKIHGLLGRGGTSVVYEAQQVNPNRRVALKVVSTLGVHADLERRFELEAQIMGSFMHPGIASIHETGRVDLGPTEALFIAMELVQGEHLIDYIRRTQPRVEDRVQIMMDICDAIDHAHGQGVIHRDLKPGNIMVDKGGHIKVLDFGIARITNPDSVDATMHTEPGRIIGTLAYMSPEQLRGESHTLGVQSDVYALGVVFYQMLADRLPYNFHGSIANAADLLENSTHQRLGTIDTRLRGDLETIIDKALEKDPQRRYVAVSALRDDLQRYLKHEPIEARAPTAWYHTKQFVRRHKAVSVGSMLAVLGLVIGVLALSIGIIRERDARRIAEDRTRTMQSMMSFLLKDMLEQADTRTNTDRDLTVMEALENAAENIEVRFPDDPIVAANIERMIGRSQVSLGRFEEAEPHLLRSIELFTETLGPEDVETLLAREELGVMLNKTSRIHETRSWLEQLHVDRQRMLGEEHPDTLRSVNDLALLYSRVGEYELSKGMHERLISLRTVTEGELGFGTLLSKHNLGLTLLFMGEFEQAISIYEDVVPKRIETLGPEHPATLLSMNNLAGGYRELGRDDDAIEIYERVDQIQQRTLGKDHPARLLTLGNIANLLLRTNPAAAEEPLMQAYESRQRVLGPDHIETLVSQRMYGQWLVKMWRRQEGVEELRNVYERQLELLGADHRDTRGTEMVLTRIRAESP